MHINIWRGHEEQFIEPETRYLMVELSTRRANIIRQMQEFIVMLEGNGVPAADQPSHVAEAMTNRRLPTVLYHPIPISHELCAIIFLHVLPGGKIPAEAIEIEPGTCDNWPHGPVRVIGPAYYDYGLPGVLPEHDRLYSITYGQVPIIDTSRVIDSVNIGFIEKMDAHIPAMQTA